MREKLISAFGGEKKSNLFRGITPSCRSVSPLVGVVEAEFCVERFDNLWSGDIRVEAPASPTIIFEMLLISVSLRLKCVKMNLLRWVQCSGVLYFAGGWYGCGMK